MYEGPDGLIYGSRTHYEKATEYWGLVDNLQASIDEQRELDERRRDRIDEYLREHSLRSNSKSTAQFEMKF